MSESIAAGHPALNAHGDVLNAEPDSDAGKRRPYVGLDLSGYLAHGGDHYERGCLCLGC